MRRRPQAQIDSIFRSVCLFCFHFSSFLTPNTEANGRAAADKEQDVPGKKLGTIPGLRRRCRIVACARIAASGIAAASVSGIVACGVVIAGISSVTAVIGFSRIAASGAVASTSVSGITARSRCSAIARLFYIAARCGRASVLPGRELCNLGILIALQAADGAFLVLQTGFGLSCFLVDLPHKGMGSHICSLAAGTFFPVSMNIGLPSTKAVDMGQDGLLVAPAAVQTYARPHSFGCFGRLNHHNPVAVAVRLPIGRLVTAGYQAMLMVLGRIVMPDINMGMRCTFMFSVPMLFPVIASNADTMVTACVCAVGRAAVGAFSAVSAGGFACGSKAVAALRTAFVRRMAGAQALVAGITPVVAHAVPAPAALGA